TLPSIAMKREYHIHRQRCCRGMRRGRRTYNRAYFNSLAPDMRLPARILPAVVPLCAVFLCSSPAFAQQSQTPPRDEFFWLGEINKATLVINTDEGLLDKAMAPRLAAGVAKVIADGNQPGAKRPSTVITFEPLL